MIITLNRSKMHNFSTAEYNTLIEGIFSRHRSVQSAGFSPEAYKPGLERMEAFDGILGSPSKKLKAVHVAGTNGKGSVCHMLSSALAAKGMKVGLYTSPHILDFRERARIVSGTDMEIIGRNEVWDFLTGYKDTIDRLGLSFFEITTGLAFWWFEKEKVDIAVIETGLGGRLDSTNILPCPVLSIVTSIGLDHCDILGPTREAIASEKAGIFKPGSIALTGTEDEQTKTVFERKALQTGCELHFADGVEGRRIYDALGAALLPGMDLKGEYQSINLRTVLRALQLMGFSDGDIRAMSPGITGAAAISGLHGRWEILAERPLTIADIGHNPPALEWNFRQLRKISAEHDLLFIIYGVMADKAVDDILPLIPSGENVRHIFTTPRTERAMKAECILERFRRLRPECAGSTASPSVADAIRQASGEASEDSLIYIGGSTFVVSDALTYITSMSDSLIHP